MYKFLLVFLVSFGVQADTDWARVAMNTAVVMDWAQTRDIARLTDPSTPAPMTGEKSDIRMTESISQQNTMYEANPILGKYPSDAEVNRYFLFALLSYNMVGEYLISEKYRGYFYGGITLVHGQAVLHNYSVGFKFRFD